MIALVTKGRLKGKEVKISQWANDWFTINTGTPLDRFPLSPTQLAFSNVDMNEIEEDKGKGMMFAWYIPVPTTKYGSRYIWTFKRRK